MKLFVVPTLSLLNAFLLLLFLPPPPIHVTLLSPPDPSFFYEHLFLLPNSSSVPFLFLLIPNLSPRSLLLPLLPYSHTVLYTSHYIPAHSPFHPPAFPSPVYLFGKDSILTWNKAEISLQIELFHTLSHTRTAREGGRKKIYILEEILY
jgi:hypothetical protein